MILATTTNYRHKIINLILGQIAVEEKKLMSEAARLFASRKYKQQETQFPEDELLLKIWQLNVENDFLRYKEL